MAARIGGMITCLLAVISTASGAMASEAIELSPRIQPNDLTKVSVQLEAGGHTLVRAESADGRNAGPEQRLPVSSQMAPA